MPVSNFGNLDVQQQTLQLKLSAGLLYHDLKRIMRPNRVRDLEAAIDNYGLEIDELSHDEQRRRAYELGYSFQAMKRARAAIVATDQSLSIVEASLCMPKGSAFCRHRKLPVAAKQQDQTKEDRRQPVVTTSLPTPGSDRDIEIHADINTDNHHDNDGDWENSVQLRRDANRSPQQSGFPEFLDFPHTMGLQALLEQSLRNHGITA